jgi:diamine N-acetyltransferase
MHMIILRELQKTDLPTLNQWRNDPELINTLGTTFRYIAPEIDEQWYNEYLSNRDRNIRLAIVEEKSGDFVGCVNLTNISTINLHAEFSIMIGSKKHRGKGYGMQASEALIRHGFMNVNLHRIYLFVLSNNLTAIGLYKRLNFQQEGIMRQVLYKNGSYHDEVVMSLLREEYILWQTPK